MFVEQPFKLELKRYPKLLLQGKPTSEMFSWNFEENVRQSVLFLGLMLIENYTSNTQIRFYVVEKATGKVVDTHFTAPNCCIFHHINAYEEDGTNFVLMILNFNFMTLVVLCRAYCCRCLCNPECCCICCIHSGYFGEYRDQLQSQALCVTS